MDWQPVEDCQNQVYAALSVKTCLKPSCCILDQGMKVIFSN